MVLLHVYVGSRTRSVLSLPTWFVCFVPYKEVQPKEEIDCLYLT